MVCKGYLDLFQFLLFCMFIYLPIIIHISLSRDGNVSRFPEPPAHTRVCSMFRSEISPIYTSDDHLLASNNSQKHTRNIHVYKSRRYISNFRTSHFRFIIVLRSSKKRSLTFDLRLPEFAVSSSRNTRSSSRKVSKRKIRSNTLSSDSKQFASITATSN